MSVCYKDRGIGLIMIVEENKCDDRSSRVKGVRRLLEEEIS